MNIKRIFCLSVLFFLQFCIPLAAQIVPYAGVGGGIVALSSDAQSVLTTNGLNSSSYAPANGPLLNVFAGAHLGNYFSLQATYGWNGNDLILSSSSSASNSFYVERRTSSQHAVLVDSLVYFRPLESRIRPYLSVGTGLVHFTSTQQQIVASNGALALPPVHFLSTKPVLHVPVGVDIAMTRRIAFRYSFSETIRHNDISQQLAPAGKKSLAAFQNLFALVFRL